MANQYANWHKKYNIEAAKSSANFSILILVKQDKSLERGTKTLKSKSPDIYIYTFSCPWMCENCFVLKTKFVPYSYLFFYGQPFVVFPNRFLLLPYFLSYYTTNYFQILLSIKFMVILQLGVWFWFLFGWRKVFKQLGFSIEGCEKDILITTIILDLLFSNGS